MIYGYARVSTKGQAKDGNSLERQTALLKEARAEVIYTDSFTGTTTSRPEFDKMKEAVKEGDTVVVTKLDRLARSAAHGIGLIEGFISRGVKVHVLNMGIMDDTATGKLIRNIMLSFAEFERDMIVERTQEGKAIARSKGKRVDGRPNLPITAEEFNKVLRQQQEGLITVEDGCKRLKISRRSWYNLAKRF